MDGWTDESLLSPCSSARQVGGGGGVGLSPSSRLTRQRARTPDGGHQSALGWRVQEGGGLPVWSGLHQGPAGPRFPLIALFPSSSVGSVNGPALGWTQHSPDIRAVPLSSTPPPPPPPPPICKSASLLSDEKLTELSRILFFSAAMWSSWPGVGRGEGGRLQRTRTHRSH